MEYELEEGFPSTKWDIWILVIYPGDYQTVHIIIQWFNSIAGRLKLHDIAGVNENFTFTYTNNETDESVWPGKSRSV